MKHLQSTYRSHTCGELKRSDVDAHVTLSGWIHRMRDHGGVIFIDLRDNYGLTQVVFHGEMRTKVESLRVESVITVRGKVLERSKETINPKLPTGEVEVECSALEVQSTADQIPFLIADDDNAPEATRLTYRFLELRREALHKNILLRSKVIFAVRRIMYELGFHEFQTPILTSSSPEGARDFIVPSRLHPGKFFALPQAPQQFKQLLMVSGFDRYFQIAPCFRDEDARADRSPGEFYQIDLEMSFVEEQDVFRTCEEMFLKLFSEFAEGREINSPFPRIRYEDALEWYGTDKPDLRIPFKIENVSEVFKNTGFQVFKNTLASGGKIYGIKLDLKETPPRKYFDDTVEFYKKLAGVGVVYLSFEKGAPKGGFTKFLSPEETVGLKERLDIGESGTVFLAAGRGSEVLPHLAKLRVKVAQDFDLVEKNCFRFCWIYDYPMYERSAETGQIEFSHNPFSMPQGGLEALLTKDPLDIHAWQYDVVCNGYELSSGAIRNHRPDIMYKAFEIAGYSKDDVDKKFGGMIRAFKFGAPPHGGMAPGVDRIVMLLANEQTIREVIAFPLAQNAEDLLMGAPSSVTLKQLKDVHIRVELPPDEKALSHAKMKE